MSMVTRRALLAVGVFVLASPPPATADCGAEPTQKVVVARGESPAGLRWLIKARNSVDDYADSFFELGGRLRFKVSVPQSLFPRFPGDAHPFPGVRPGRETAILGLLPNRVVRVEIRVKRAGLTRVRPVSPPSRKERRLCWLKDVRFLAVFLEAGSHVKRITGYNARGDTVYLAREHRGGDFYRHSRESSGDRRARRSRIGERPAS